MFSRLVASTLEKLSIKDNSASKTSGSSFPTLSFPTPPPVGIGTTSLCPRCLTLLTHVVSQFGDGTGYTTLVMPHSQSLAHLSARKQVMTSSQGKISAEPASSASTTSCVICTKTLILFNAARAHSAFDKSLTKTRYTEWSLRWTIDAPDPKIYPQFAFPHDNVSVLMTVDHKGGYGWGIGTYWTSPSIIMDLFRTQHLTTSRGLQNISGLERYRRKRS
jgi:hypothetical protein